MRLRPIAFHCFVVNTAGALSLQIRKCHLIILPDQFNLRNLNIKFTFALFLAFRWHVLSFTQKSCLTSISSDKNDNSDMKVSLTKKNRNGNLDYKL